VLEPKCIAICVVVYDVRVTGALSSEVSALAYRAVPTTVGYHVTSAKEDAVLSNDGFDDVEGAVVGVLREALFAFPVSLSAQGLGGWCHFCDGNK
jgi:hypothetical protein